MLSGSIYTCIDTGEIFSYNSTDRVALNQQVSQEVDLTDVESRLDSLESGHDDLSSSINGLASANPDDVFYARRTEFLDEGINLYNKEDTANLTNGWLNGTNVPQTHATATHTKYFPLSEGQDYWYLNAYVASTYFVITDSSHNISRAISGTVDGTFTAQTGEAFVRFSVRNIDNFMFAKGSAIGTYEPYLFRIKPSVIDDNVFKNKKGLLFGDSITWLPNGWHVKFNQLIRHQELLNYAISGQKITWRAGATETTNPPSDGNDNNVFWNSIKKWEATTPDAPDFIIIALGTNDISQGSPMGSMTDAYSNTVANIDNMTMANAYRKAVHYLQVNYPNAQIFYYTPLQSKTGGRNWTTITNVRNILTEISERMNVKVIDTTMLSGISEEHENVSGAGRYYYDGTHPTYDTNDASKHRLEHGQVEFGVDMQGRCIASEFRKLFYLD